MKVICIGQAAYDITLPVSEFPIENKKIRIPSRIECGGGSSSNVAYLMAKWGLDVYFAGVIGKDNYGQIIKKEFSDVGISLKYLEEQDNVLTTASYIISNFSNGKRTILTNRQANLKLSKNCVEDSFDIIYSDGYEGDFVKEIIEKNPNAIKVLDAGSMKEQTVELGYLVDYLVCSKDFAEEYTKLKIDYDNLQSIINIYNILKNEFKNKIIITLEEKGSFIENDGYKLISSIKVNPVDSTGAGDIFHGAFTFFISNNYDIIESMKLANITAALSTEKIGSRNSIFSKEEILKRYKNVS